MNAELDSRARAWFQGHDTGTSSETIWSVMTGYPIQRADAPWDPADFGRCYRLLESFPEWRGRLGEVADEHHAWIPFVKHWALMEDLWREESPSGSCPELWEMMKALRP